MTVMNKLTAVALLALAASSPSCTETECATPDFTRAECRVVAENDFARLRTSGGVEIRFHELDAEQPDAAWTTEGIVVERHGEIRARVAHMGDFSISLLNTTSEARELSVALTNIHPRAVIVPDPAITELERSGARRTLAVNLEPHGVTWIRAGLGPAQACPTRFRVAVLGDVQTNPTQFARIVERLQHELGDAELAGEMLAGVVMPGDLTESSTEDEFRVFADILESAALPFALTPGNHDIYESVIPNYNQNFGPGNYSFSVCGARFAMLDTGSGAIADSVLGRLPELFERKGAQYLLAAMHHPPYSEITAAGWSREDMAMITLGEFAHQGGDLILAGHAHMLREFTNLPIAGGSVDEIIAGTAGAWQGGGQPIYGYVRLTFDSGNIERCFVEVPPPGGLPHIDTPTTIPQCTSA